MVRDAAMCRIAYASACWERAHLSHSAVIRIEDDWYEWYCLSGVHTITMPAL